MTVLAQKMIYVVMGTTGDYSDRTEWPVYWTENEEEANAYVDIVTKEFAAQIATSGNRYDNRSKITEHFRSTGLDPTFGMDYDVSWFVMPVPSIPTRH